MVCSQLRLPPPVRVILELEFTLHYLVLCKWRIKLGAQERANGAPASLQAKAEHMQWGRGNLYGLEDLELSAEHRF